MILLRYLVAFIRLLGAFSVLPALSVRAERLVVVAHPDTHLAAGDVQFPQEAETWHLKAVTLLPPLFVPSADVKDAPGDRAFVLVLGKPGTQIVNHLSRLVPGGSGNDQTREYRTISVVAAMGFALCYREEPGGPLAELGRGVVWREASQMNLDEDENANHYERVPYKISQETPEELTRRALQLAVQDIPRLVSHIVTPNVLVPKAEPCASAEQVLAWAKKIPEEYSWKINTRVTSHGRHGMLATHATNNFARLKPAPAYSGTYEAKFHPSRVNRNQDGSLTVEVDLWNRMPIRVAGRMRRDASEEEEALRDISSEAAPVTAEKKSSRFMALWDLAISATFDLEPGEKGVATFHIPPEWAVKPEIVRGDTIVVGIRKLGLMAERAEKKTPPAPTRKKRK